MNDLEYLNQISASANRPAKTGFFDKKMKIIFGILGGVILFFIIIAAVTSGSPKSKPTITSELSRLYSWTTELSKTVTNYNPSVRSSSLRSKGAQFSTHLTEISSSASTFLTQNLGVETKSIVANADDMQIITDLNATLEKARLNGILDHRYAYEMDYQVRYLLNLEDSIIKKTDNTIIRTFFESSVESLNLIRESFHNFSESD